MANSTRHLPSESRFLFLLSFAWNYARSPFGSHNRESEKRISFGLALLNGYLADLGDALFAQALKENKQEIAYQTVESFCEVKGGKRLPKGSELISDANSHPYIRVRDLNNTTVLQLTPEMLYVDDETQANISRYIVNDGDVIVSVVGTIGMTAYIGNTLNGANLTENCNKLTSFNGDLAAWSYFFLRSPDGAEAIRLGTVGAVQAKLPLKNIKSIEVPFIPALEMEKTVAKLNDILSAIQINLVESLALGELRTTLLPRLISGEIDVSKIDITQLNWALCPGIPSRISRQWSSNASLLTNPLLHLVRIHGIAVLRKT